MHRHRGKDADAALKTNRINDSPTLSTDAVDRGRHIARKIRGP